MNSARIIILVAAIAAIVLLAFVTGWANAKAQPGSKGRVQVTRPASNDSP